MPRFKAGLVLLLAALTGCSARPPAASGTDDWRAYGHDPEGSRFSPLTEINRHNVGGLQVAWTYHTGETDPRFHTDRRTSLEVTPIVVDSVMYLSTPLGRVIALDPESGQERWKFDPEIDRTIEYGDFTSRGVSYWADSAATPGQPCGRRIYIATIDGRLIGLDASTGTRCPGFGEAGAVDLHRGLRTQPYQPSEYEETSPPAIVNGVIVVGSAIADNSRIDVASGEVRGFDARTGRLRWTWDPVPQDSTEPGWATWRGPNAHRTGAANAWSIIAADPARDLVIVPTGSASPDYFGGERLGQNLYANSVVALRASTGSLVWHFQTVHHDLWDYDNASPPALVMYRRDGVERPAVLQATKTGQLFVLDRETGAPLLPVEERPVPRSDVPGEDPWPTQPFTAAIPPLSPHQMAAADAWGFVPGDRAACRARIDSLRNDGIFTPPSIKGTLVLPSNIGGAHWGGVAYDPVREIAVIPTNRIAALIKLVPRERWDSEIAAANRGERSGIEFGHMFGTPYFLERSMLLSPHGLPCTPPPFGALVAVSLRTGQKIWEVPLGTTRDFFAEKLHLPIALKWGLPNLGGPIVTADGVVFIAAAFDHYLRAFDIETGKELWKGRLPAGGKATPMTYRVSREGRQYVVVAAGGDRENFGWSDAIVAFALKAPRRGPATAE